jgi:type II secretory pathway component PulF
MVVKKYRYLKIMVMSANLYPVVLFVFIIIVILILRKTEVQKIDAMGRFFKSLNPFSIFKKR